MPCHPDRVRRNYEPDCQPVELNSRTVTSVDLAEFRRTTMAAKAEGFTGVTDAATGRPWRWDRRAGELNVPIDVEGRRYQVGDFARFVADEGAWRDAGDADALLAQPKRERRQYGVISVRDWFRKLRAQAFAKGLATYLYSPCGDGPWGDPVAWTLFDTQAVVDRETAPHYVIPGPVTAFGDFPIFVNPAVPVGVLMMHSLTRRAYLAAIERLSHGA